MNLIMKSSYIFIGLAVVFAVLGFLFLPKTKPIQKAPSQNTPSSPAPQPKSVQVASNPKPAIQLLSNGDWQIFLPQGSGWINTGKRVIKERGTAVYYPKSNSITFTTDDWRETYIVRVGNSEIKNPNQRAFSIGAQDGDCLPVFIKNVSDHDLALVMQVSNYPSQNDPPSCK